MSATPRRGKAAPGHGRRGATGGGVTRIYLSTALAWGIALDSSGAKLSASILRDPGFWETVAAQALAVEVQCGRLLHLPLRLRPSPASPLSAPPAWMTTTHTFTLLRGLLTTAISLGAPPSAVDEFVVSAARRNGLPPADRVALEHALDAAIEDAHGRDGDDYGSGVERKAIEAGAALDAAVAAEGGSGDAKAAGLAAAPPPRPDSAAVSGVKAPVEGRRGSTAPPAATPGASGSTAPAAAAMTALTSAAAAATAPATPSATAAPAPSLGSSGQAAAAAAHTGVADDHPHADPSAANGSATTDAAAAERHEAQQLAPLPSMQQSINHYNPPTQQHPWSHLPPAEADTRARELVALRRNPPPPDAEVLAHLALLSKAAKGPNAGPRAGQADATATSTSSTISARVGLSLQPAPATRGTISSSIFAGDDIPQPTPASTAASASSAAAEAKPPASSSRWGGASRRGLGLGPIIKRFGASTGLSISSSTFSAALPPEAVDAVVAAQAAVAAAPPPVHPPADAPATAAAGADPHSPTTWTTVDVGARGLLDAVLHTLNDSHAGLADGGRRAADGSLLGAITALQMNCLAFRGHAAGAAITSLSSDPRNGRVATGGNDGRVVLWDMSSRTYLHSYDDHGAAVTAVVVAGDVVFSASQDSTVRVSAFTRRAYAGALLEAEAQFEAEEAEKRARAAAAAAAPGPLAAISGWGKPRASAAAAPQTPARVRYTVDGEAEGDDEGDGEGDDGSVAHGTDGDHDGDGGAHHDDHHAAAAAYAADDLGSGPEPPSSLATPAPTDATPTKPPTAAAAIAKSPSRLGLPSFSAKRLFRGGIRRGGAGGGDASAPVAQYSSTLKLKGHSGPVTSLAVWERPLLVDDGSATGGLTLPSTTEYIAVSGGADGAVKTWGVKWRLDRRGRATGTVTPIGSHTSLHKAGGVVECLAMSRDGRYVASGGRDGRVGLVDISGDRSWSMAMPQAPTKGVFAPLAKWTTSGRAAAALTGMDPLIVPTGLPIVTVLITAGVAGGPVVLTSSGADGTTRVWDLRTGGAAVGFPSGSPVWSHATIRAHGAGLPTRNADGSFAEPPSPLGDAFLLSTHEDGVVRKWDARRPSVPLVAWPGHAGAVTSLSVAHGACDRFVTGGTDGAVRLWDASNGLSLAFEGHTAAIAPGAGVAQADDYVVSGSWDGAMRVWFPVT